MAFHPSFVAVYATLHCHCIRCIRSMETTWTRGGEEEYTESIWRLLRHMGMVSIGGQQQRLTPRLFKETGEYEDARIATVRFSCAAYSSARLSLHFVGLGSGHVQGGPYNTPVDGLYKVWPNRL